MDWIYPISYLLSLSGLVLWFFVQGNKHLSRNMSALFLGGFLVYLAALSFSSGTLGYKLITLMRDMVVMGIVTQLFNFSKNRVLLSIGLGAVAILIVYFSYFQTLRITFPQLPAKEIDTEGEFLVRIDPERRDVLDRMQKAFPSTIEAAFHPSRAAMTDLDAYFIVNLASDKRRTYKEFYTTFAHSAAVEWIEPNELLLSALPESELAQRKQGRHYVNDPDIGMQWGFDPMDVDQLHRLILESGLKPVRMSKIAILDSGVDGAHKDLRASYQSLNTSYDADKVGHGTHCAGIAGAVSNNRLGIASLAPGEGFVQIMGIKVINALGLGTQEMVIDGIIEAVDKGADVISLSLGGMSSQKKQKAYEEAVSYATKQGVIVVVAAGNYGKSAKDVSPANVNGVITVAALDRNSRRAQFSSTVEELDMGVSAPGVDIYSTLPGGKYGTLSGTSMATPYVSGLIGLMKSFHPDLSAKEVFQILKETGKETADGSKTGPLIQPVKALERVID